MITFAPYPLNKKASLENQFRDGCVDYVFSGHSAKIQTQVKIERLSCSLSLYLYTVLFVYDTAAK